MKDRKHSSRDNHDDDETITNVTLFSPDAVDADTDMQRLGIEIPASNTTYSLGRLEQDLKVLHSKWQTVEKEMTQRDQKISMLQREIDVAQRENTSLKELKDKLEKDLDNRQGSAATAGVRLAEIESQNVELRVHLQELQDYIDGRKADWENLNSKLREYEDTIRGMHDRVAAHEEIVAEKEAEKASLAAKVMELERDLAELKGRHTERESSHDALQHTLSEQARELGDLNGEAIRLQKDVKKLQAELKAKDGRIESLESDIEEQQNDGASAVEILETRSAEFSELEAQLQAAEKTIDALNASESSLGEKLAAANAQLEEVGVSSAEHEIRAVELQAVLLETQSEQQNLEAELEAQRELIQVLEQEISNKQDQLDGLDRGADHLSVIASENRKIDFQIDDDWCEQPAALFEGTDDIFDPDADDVMLTPEELFPEPGELAQHIIVSIEEGGIEPVQYALTEPEMVIGRSHKAHIRLKNKYISREHAVLTIDESGVVIKDAGSMNGFLVNAEPTSRHRLQHGDELEIGKARFQYLDASMS